MSKIIKPKLNPDGSQAIRKLQKGDWYYNSNINTFQEYIHAGSFASFPIYYAEEWKPAELEKYWHYSFHPLYYRIFNFI